jgi:hypothetical protein
MVVKKTTKKAVGKAVKPKAVKKAVKPKCTSSSCKRSPAKKSARVEDDSLVDFTKGVVKTGVGVLAATALMGAFAGAMHNNN